MFTPPTPEAISRAQAILPKVIYHRDPYEALRDAGANGTRKIYCAKAIYLADESIGVRSDHGLLQINLSPLRGRLPILEADEKRELSAEFQAKCNHYNLTEPDQVRDSQFDLPEFSSPMRILARVLGAPIVVATELQGALGTLLRDYEKSIRAAPWVDGCVVIEAVLLRSHDDQTERPCRRNHTRRQRDPDARRGCAIGSEEVGGVLRQLGLSPMRDPQGIRNSLERKHSPPIHQLASRLALATVQEGTVLCAHRAEFVPLQPRNEGRVASME